MNWEDERYVRLYVRDTVTWKLMGWQARCLLPLLLRKVDRVGCLNLDGAGAEGIAALVDIPLEVADPGFRALMARGVVEVRDGVLIFPRFLEAQEAKHSDKARQAESRGRKRDALLRDMKAGDNATERDEESQSVTNNHAMGQSVTSSHAPSHDVTPSRTVLSLAVPSRAEEAKASMLAGGPSPTPPATTQIALLPDEPKPARKTRERKPRATAEEDAGKRAAGAAVWEAYAAAFRGRYGCDPQRNAKVNGQIAQFLARVPLTDAPEIARWYVRHSGAFYAASMHAVGLMLRDAEKLAAEWRRGERVNAETARRNEQTEANPFAQELLRRQRERAQRGDVIEARSDDEAGT